MKRLFTAILLFLLVSTTAYAGLSQFVGNWRNVDRKTRGLTRLNISLRGQSVYVQAFGKAHPKENDLGKKMAYAFAPNAGANMQQKAIALTVKWDHGFGKRLVTIRLAGRALSVYEYMRFTDKSGRTNYTKKYRFVRAAGTSGPRLKEDCISFNWKTIKVKKLQGRWKIVDGNHWIMDFKQKVGEARKALSIIKRYRMNSICFVGRPDPSMTYFKTNGKAPVGKMAGEDAIAFNPTKIEAKKVKGRWKIVEGSHWIMDFDQKAAEAKKALAIIRRYGFNHICFVGRPNPSMTYFRR